MHIVIMIEVSEEKDGTLTLKYNGKNLGDLNDVKPLDEIDVVYNLIKLNEKLNDSHELRKETLKEIQQRLAKLLAWYYTEF